MNEIIKLEDIKKYSLNNGKYGKFIKIETNNNKYFNISLDSEQKQILNKDNLNDDIFNKLLKIYTMKQEIKTINEEIKELINK
jgi:hypothetical protein